jgi:hypothetical protein
VDTVRGNGRVCINALGRFAECIDRGEMETEISTWKGGVVFAATKSCSFAPSLCLCLPSGGKTRPRMSNAVIVVPGLSSRGVF